MLVFALDKLRNQVSSNTALLELTRKWATDNIDTMNKNEVTDGNHVDATGTTASGSGFPAERRHTKSSVLAPTSQGKAERNTGPSSERNDSFK